MRRFVHAFVALALLCAANLHLPLLQVVAWAGMLATYSQDRSLAEAAQMTFDGEHPCPMCKAIKKQQAATKDAPLAHRPAPKLDLFPGQETPSLITRLGSCALQQLTAAPPGMISRAPEVPPPRVV